MESGRGRQLQSAEDPSGVTAPVDVIPIGGVGEFGMNMLLVACGDTAVLVDAGVMFPEPELFGVDLVIPDLAVLDAYRGRIKALVFTHGHEDHIGAVAHVLSRFDGPVLATRFTLALIEPKLEEHGIDAADRLVAVAPGERRSFGPLTLEFLRVTHSIPDCLAVAIHTPAGVIVHTGDFKIDQTPLDGGHFDLHRLAELGSSGVLALLSDSTNADRRGFTGSERDVVDGFEEIFSSATGKIVVTAFSTSIYRLQLLADLADQFDRKLAFVGRGMQQTVADRPTPRRALGPGRRPDPRQRSRRLSSAGRGLRLHWVPGSGAGRPAPHRDRRPPARPAGARGRGGLLGPQHPRQ